MYHELSLDLLDEADPRWLHRRRKTVLTAFRLAKDIHTLLMQKSEEFVSPYRKRKRRPVKVYRSGRRGRKHWTSAASPLIRKDRNGGSKCFIG